MKLEQIKSCLITGATSGIGKALALKMGEKKIPLLLTGRNEEELKQLQGQTGAQIFVADLSDISSLKDLNHWINEKNPNLQIHNAGFGLRGPYENLTDQDIQAMITTNCTALALQTKDAILRWKQKGEKGIVLNVASIVAHFPFPYSALYAATKAFVRNLSLSVEGEQEGGIRVLTSCPGAVETDFFRRSRNGNEASTRGRMPVEVAVRSILRQIQTERQEVLFDWKYAFLARLASVLPLSLLRSISKRGD